MTQAVVKLYIRFGEIPPTGKSKIYASGEPIGEELGVSVYRAVVYIKGIKTPAIVKVHYLNGRRYVEDPQSGEWREMVDIPPHGRLGDLDALYRRIKAECNPYGNPTISYDDGLKVLGIIDSTPTIVPAEEEA